MDNLCKMYIYFSPVNILEDDDACMVYHIYVCVCIDTHACMRVFALFSGENYSLAELPRRMFVGNQQVREKTISGWIGFKYKGKEMWASNYHSWNWVKMRWKEFRIGWLE